MADTKEFDVIRVARSDGVDTGPGYWPNNPAPATKKPAKDADKTPRAKAQMVRLEENDPRFIEWRIKLGILLKQELSPHPDEGNAWYVHFPRGYWLYEKSKHLWVSGYPIKSKLFKSPQEFGLHLIWLLSSSQKYEDCCCVHCNSPNAVTNKGGDEALVVIEPEKSTSRVTPVPLPEIPGQPDAKPPRATKKAQQAATDVPAQKATAKPKAKASTVATDARVNPSVTQTMAVPTPAQPWNLLSPLMYRVGELVWFQNGNTWRLGVIAGRLNGGHEILPIGHGLIIQQNLGKREVDMRPFHAFSVPPVAVSDLSNKAFDDIQWAAVFQNGSSDGNRRDVLLLDASKMAASKIDQSYSLWSPKSKDLNAQVVPYQGCFLGAERIEVGDCLRLTSGTELGTNSDKAVLAVSFIITNKDYPGTVLIRGHVYALIPSNTPNAVFEDPQSLPAALREEQQWRSQIDPQRADRYAILKRDVVIKESSVRGRFYPIHQLMPILDPAGFQAAMASQQLDGLQAHLNQRSTNVVPKTNRLESLGASVPPGASLAFEGFVQENGQPGRS